MGKKDSTDDCAKITNGPKLINPVRSSAEIVTLADKLTLQTTSEQAVCAVGLGGSSADFLPHGQRSASAGTPNSWMNIDASVGAGSVSTMLRVDIYHTNFNIIDRTANPFADTWGGKCTCPDGSELMVAAKLSTNCEELQCYGGTTSACEKSSDASWSHKAGYCSASAQAKQEGEHTTIDTTQIFEEMETLTPTRSLEGGSISVSSDILDYPTKQEWIRYERSTVANHYTLLKDHSVLNIDECRKKCQDSARCLGFQRSRTCNCCLFVGPVVIQAKSDEKETFFEMKKIRYVTAAETAPDNELIHDPKLCLTNSTTGLNLKSFTVTIGTSLRDGSWEAGANTKTTTFSQQGSITCPTVVNKNNWLSDCDGRFCTYKDTFTITVVGNQITARRTDLSTGWPFNLQFTCTTNDTNTTTTNGTLTHDCDCCAKVSEARCGGDAILEMSSEACAIKGSEFYFKCKTKKDFDTLDPLYSSGQFDSNSIYNGNAIGSGHARGRLSDHSEGAWLAAKNIPGQAYWGIKVRKDGRPGKVLGFSVRDRTDNGHTQYVTSWFVNYANTWTTTSTGEVQSKNVLVNKNSCCDERRVCSSGENDFYYHAHRAGGADRGKRLDFLFSQPISTTQILLVPNGFVNHMSASLALIVEKTPKPPLPLKIPQFGVK